MSPPRDHLEPQRLLEHAKRLLDDRGDRGRPFDIDLRRAVSAAYYALFHQLTASTATQVFGDLDAARGYVVRWLNHGDVAQAARLVSTFSSRSELDPRWQAEKRAMWHLVHSAPPTSELLSVCETFVDLQQRRHDADYDRARRVSKPDATQAIADAEQALQSIQTLVDTSDPAWSVFLGLIAFSANRVPRP
ncbi:MAG: hypothetical protein QM679_08720 [Patulibacter sp.]